MSLLVGPRSGRLERSLIHWSRLAVVVLAWIYASGVAVQLVLGGIAVVMSNRNWQNYATFGHWLGLVSSPLLLAALDGSLPVRLIMMAGALPVLHGLQHVSANRNDGVLVALIPITSLVLLGCTSWLALGARALIDLSRSASGAVNISSHLEEPRDSD